MSQYVRLRDAFISYSSKDAEIVKPLVDRLDAASIKVWYAPASVERGAAFMDEVSEGLLKSQLVVVFLSPSAIGSFWVTQEWQARFVQMADDKTLGILPVLLPGVDKSNLPLLLRTRDRLNFVDYDFKDPVVVEKAANELTKAIRGELPKPGAEVIGVPIVVLAMTKEELAALESGAAFKDKQIPVAQMDKPNFAKLKKFLLSHGIPDLSIYYGSRREDWKPAIAPVTIRSAVDEIVSRVNDARAQQPAVSLLRPQFFSSEFFADDAALRTRIWSYLQQLGGVVIVDAVSMYHPRLRELFLMSGLAASTSMSLVVLSPLSPRESPHLKGLKDIENQVSARMPLALNRFEQQLDLLCEFGVGDVHNLRRWLFAVLPESAMRIAGQRPNEEQAAAMRETLGAPRGFIRLVSGRSGQ